MGINNWFGIQLQTAAVYIAHFYLFIAIIGLNIVYRDFFQEFVYKELRAKYPPPQGNEAADIVIFQAKLALFIEFFSVSLLYTGAKLVTVFKCKKHYNFFTDINGWDAYIRGCSTSINSLLFRYYYILRKINCVRNGAYARLYRSDLYIVVHSYQIF